MTTAARDGRGRRRVTLYVPIEGQTPEPLTEIVFAPVTASVMWRWEDGQIDGVIALLCELSGWSRDWLGAMPYPDYEFVIEEFMAHLPDRLRRSIAEGRIPMVMATAPADEEQPSVGNGADGDPVPVTSEKPITVADLDDGLGFGGLDPNG